MVSGQGKGWKVAAYLRAKGRGLPIMSCVKDRGRGESSPHHAMPAWGEGWGWGEGEGEAGG